MKDKYIHWTVLSQEKVYRNNKVYLSCQCDCGTKREVIIKNLKSGISSSCGCIGRAKTIKRNTKHNKRFTKTWRVWQAMKNRCYNKNFTQYERYGGRGITVCDEWRNDFIAFYNYIGDIPKNKSIDRIDNNGNYETSNVRLATQKEQCQNKSNNRKINGVCITEISLALGGAESLVDKRIKRGWSINKAISEKTNANI